MKEREVEKLRMKGIQVEERPGGEAAQRTAAGPVGVLLVLSIQDLLRGPERKVVQRDAQRHQPVLTGVQQCVVLLQIKPTSLSISVQTTTSTKKQACQLTDLTVSSHVTVQGGDSGLFTLQDFLQAPRKKVLILVFKSQLNLPVRTDS